MKKITDYAELVKAKHALNKTIAPVEDGASMAGSYTSGKQFIRDSVLYSALTSIAAGTAWSSLTLDTDYEVADDVSTQIAAVNQTLTNEISAINEMGAINLLKHSSVSSTELGITWTVNSDGTVTANSDGTNTSNIIKILDADFSAFKNGGIYKLSCCPSGGAINSTYAVWFHTTDNSVDLVDIGNGVVFTYNSAKTYQIALIIYANYNASNVVFKPMITLATIAQSDYAHYQPYSMTNQELTSKLQAKKYTHLAEVFTLGYVTAVSGDTRSSMLDKLYADAASRLAAVSNDSFFVETIRLVISDGTRAIAPMGLLNKTSTFPELNFIDSSIDASTGSVIHEVWNMKSSGSKQSSAVVRSDGTTLYQNDSASVNAGVTYALYAQRYIANDAVLS